MSNIHSDIAKYYTGKINKFGNTPQGVDWKDEDSQKIRFQNLIKILDKGNSFSVNDLGCGYGKLIDFLNQDNYKNYVYFGYDLSLDMIKSAKNIYNLNNCSFLKINDPSEMNASDFTIASGIFNVKMDYKDQEWLDYILKTIEHINIKSKKGFSFNILTKYSDKEYMRKDLYYADPCFFFDYCKRNYARNVALLHDYDLYEFTILVRKNG